MRKRCFLRRNTQAKSGKSSRLQERMIVEENLKCKFAPKKHSSHATFEIALPWPENILNARNSPREGKRLRRAKRRPRERENQIKNNEHFYMDCIVPSKVCVYIYAAILSIFSKDRSKKPGCDRHRMFDVDHDTNARRRIFVHCFPFLFALHKDGADICFWHKIETRMENILKSESLTHKLKIPKLDLKIDGCFAFVSHSESIPATFLVFLAKYTGSDRIFDGKLFYLCERERLDLTIFWRALWRRNKGSIIPKKSQRRFSCKYYSTEALRDGILCTKNLGLVSADPNSQIFGFAEKQLGKMERIWDFGAGREKEEAS